MKFLRLAPLVLLAPGATLAAPVDREQALKLSNVVITANRQVEDRAQSSAANTVFTREDIDRLQPTNITDLLNRVPGVQVARTGGR
ncbi:MAG: TonB-dependent receptor plug domain-containing protein, partial [Pseudomonas sp.]